MHIYSNRAAELQTRVNQVLSNLVSTRVIDVVSCYRGSVISDLQVGGSIHCERNQIFNVGERGGVHKKVDLVHVVEIRLNLQCLKH